jgi:hypothetical protein
MCRRRSCRTLSSSQSPAMVCGGCALDAAERLWPTPPRPPPPPCPLSMQPSTTGTAPFCTCQCLLPVITLWSAPRGGGEAVCGLVCCGTWLGAVALPKPTARAHRAGSGSGTHSACPRGWIRWRLVLRPGAWLGTQRPRGADYPRRPEHLDLLQPATPQKEPSPRLGFQLGVSDALEP